jgi:hypothetical protein
MYKKTYLQLLKPENLDEIRKILKKSDYSYFDSESCQKIELCKEKNFPYLLLLVDSYDQMSQNHFSMLNGIFVCIDNIIKTWQGYFYLPIVVLRHIREEHIKRMATLDDLLLHELEHLFSIVDHIEQNPEYIDNAMYLNADSCNKDNIRESMVFELGKIFDFEVKALDSDFDRGERHLNLYDQGVLSRIEVKNKIEFVQHNISLYIASLFAHYKKRFPGKEEFIISIYREEVNKHGFQLFGSDAITKIALLQVEYLAKGSGLTF